VIFIYFFYKYLFILIFEPDTKSIVHKHTLSALRRLIITDTERFATAFGDEPKDYRQRDLCSHASYTSVLVVY